ncbi:CAAX prenyl protease 2-like isoform X2 [Xiphophorus hellerii]|uniref:CAAX prenyl protease 2-like isoform X2 n=1 Tax=Xiphophorus hellerii TaxID=8084 RepID=UPI0013B3B6F1|nr:CAAX prenyl protease 2-like isoform X2 [Xiphophorus hellerii]
MHWADITLLIITTHNTQVEESLWELMGVRLKGFIPASVLPLLLITSALDNPDGFSGELHSALDVQSWRMCVQDAAWLRNQVVAPVTEELVFRGAMLPMLVPCTGATAVIFIAPLLFGVGMTGNFGATMTSYSTKARQNAPVDLQEFCCSCYNVCKLYFNFTVVLAHLHHIIEQLQLGKDNVRAIFLGAGIQFLYTTVFGVFAAFIFLRTGHIVGPVLCHSFCNSQGLPDIGSALSRPQRSAVLICYLTGVLLFLVMLFPFTDPFLYGARPVCSLAASQALEC